MEKAQKIGWRIFQLFIAPLTIYFSMYYANMSTTETVNTVTMHYSSMLGLPPLIVATVVYIPCLLVSLMPAGANAFIYLFGMLYKENAILFIFILCLATKAPDFSVFEPKAASNKGE